MRYCLFLMGCACVALGCDSSVVDSSGAGASGAASGSNSSSSSGASGGGGAGGGSCGLSGDCVDDVDCPGDAACVALTDCGFKVCEQLIDDATACNEPNIDECCDTSECGAGEGCYLWPFGAMCGGVQPQAHNQCVADECQTASDCPAANPPYQMVCAPGNTLTHPKRHCFLGTCAIDADCTAKSGGVCAPVETACCSAPNALACVYPDNGCRSQSDCAGDTHCDIEGAAASCLPGPAICPA